MTCRLPNGQLGLPTRLLPLDSYIRVCFVCLGMLKLFFIDVPLLAGSIRC